MIAGGKSLRVVRLATAVASAVAPFTQKTVISAPARKYARFDTCTDISSPDSKQFKAIKDGDRIIDYQDVTIEGYLSTFKGTTESDRQGDYVDDGAFKESIPRFMRNPVMLVNHQNSVMTQAGSFEKVNEDSKGLFVKGKISNSPEMQHVRFLVAEGHLKTLSMGGIFHYKEDGRGIFKVDLWEGSLTPIPANPDAIFSVRELTEHELKQVQFGAL